jgi:hypothetical protein
MKNELELNQDNLTRFKQKACNVESKIIEAERRLHSVNDKLTFEREKCLVLHAMDRRTAADDTVSTKRTGHTVETKSNQSPTIESLLNPAPKSAPTFSFVAPKPINLKRPEGQQQHLYPKPASQTEFDRPRPPSPPPTKRLKTAMALQQFVRPSLAPPPPKAHSQADVSTPSSVQEKHDRWQAPRDQDGSGRTKLNDKFTGKY